MSKRAPRVGVGEAKARFAEIVRSTSAHRTIIQRRGQDVAVVIGMDELRRIEQASEGATDGARLIARLSRWRARTGGVEGFAPEPARVVPSTP